MRPLKIEDSPVVIAALQDEIRRTNESRYDHRLQGGREIKKEYGAGRVDLAPSLYFLRIPRDETAH